jgi:hypothetical protein
MFQNAYALFFVSVLAGSALVLWAMIRAHAREVAAVLRGDVALPQAPARSHFVRFRSGRRRAFPPVTVSICRI